MDIELSPELILKSSWCWDTKTLAWAEAQLQTRHEVMNVFPTCVGMNRRGATARCGSESVPHMRGDEPP